MNRTLRCLSILALVVACGGEKKGPESAGNEPAPAPTTGPAAATTPPSAATSATTPAEPTAAPTSPGLPPEPAPPAVDKPVEPPTNPQLLGKPTGTREEVRELRAERRAFASAPPMIPHPVDERTRDCLGCHDQNVNVAGVRAPRMSHRKYTACLQCHVWGEDEFFTSTVEAGGPDDAGTTFQPLVATPGARAFPTAPPSIPHNTFMREQCTACHGSWARPGLKTSHTERRSCAQCHVQSMTWDMAGL